MALYLLDTNLLVRQIDTGSAQSSVAIHALKALRANGATLATTAQSLMEF